MIRKKVKGISGRLKLSKTIKKRSLRNAGGIDKITLHKLHKGWNFHHEDLREENYEKLNDNFLCCNNLTHKVIHWLYTYYQKDEGIIDRLKAEMQKMKEINGGRNGD
jgi:hypothetical protein